jgi:MraZ protein
VGKSGILLFQRAHGWAFSYQCFLTVYQTETRKVMSFRGRFEAKTDSKGRLLIPSLWKPDTIGKLIITNAFYSGFPCLDVYQESEWKALEEKVTLGGNLKKPIEDFKRFYLASSSLVELDTAGRILIPASLRKFAQVESQVVLLGMGQKFEIWSQKHWSKIHEEMSREFENTMAKVVDLIDGEEQ